MWLLFNSTLETIRDFFIWTIFLFLSYPLYKSLLTLSYINIEILLILVILWIKTCFQVGKKEVLNVSFYLGSIYLCLLPLSDVKSIKIRMILLSFRCFRVVHLGQGTPSASTPISAGRQDHLCLNHSVKMSLPSLGCGN